MQNFTCKPNIISGYEKRVLIGLLLTLLFTVNIFSQSGLEESSDIIIYGDVRVYVDTSEQITTPGSLTGINGGTIHNNGTFIFDVNNNPQSIFNYSSESFITGSGLFYFTGDADFEVNGDFDTRLYNAWIQKENGAILYLGSDLGIQNRINLNEGLVVTGEESRLTIFNADSAAIVVENFDNIGIRSYIYGNLRRYVGVDTAYHFPVGLQTTYFPLRINNHLEGVDYLDVTFNENVPLTGEVGFQQALYNFQDLNQTGAWQVESDKNPAAGTMDLTAFIFDYNEVNSFETNMFGLAYNKNPQGYTDTWTLEGEYARPGSLPRMAGSDSTQLFNTNKLGYYTVAVADITKLINFISPGDGRETRFIIPGILADPANGWNEPRYESTELIVYNAMGAKIYDSKPYKNDLDMAEFKDGTYYYIFKFTRNGKPGVIQSFIDVKRVY